MHTSTADAALIIIDVHDAFDEPRWGRRNNPDAAANVARLLAAWGEAGRPIIHVRHPLSRPMTWSFKKRWIVAR